MATPPTIPPDPPPTIPPDPPPTMPPDPPPTMPLDPPPTMPPDPPPTMPPASPLMVVPPPPPPPTPSTHTSSSSIVAPKPPLTAHRFTDDHLLPYVGQLIKIRLDTPLTGPGSSRPSTSAPSRTTRYNYHSAIVISIRADIRSQMLIFIVFRIPSYSAAIQDGLNSESWVAQRNRAERMKHIPMPCVGGGGSTPIEFGDPVKPVKDDGTAYLDRRPSWIYVEEFTVRLPFTSTWKSFSRDVKFPIQDVQRLQSYSLQLLTIHDDNNITVNMLQLPDVAYPDQWLYGGFPASAQVYDFFGGSDGVILEIDPDSDDYDPNDDDDEPEYSPLEFMRMIGTKDPGMRKLLEEDDRRIKEEKEERIRQWLGEVWNEKIM